MYHTNQTNTTANSIKKTKLPDSGFLKTLRLVLPNPKQKFYGKKNTHNEPDNTNEKLRHPEGQILPGIAIYETLQTVMPKNKALQTLPRCGLT